MKCDRAPVWFFSDTKCVMFLHTPSNSRTPPWCPTIQFNSDTIHLEFGSDLMSEKAQGLPPCHTPVANGVPRLPILLKVWLQMWEFSWAPFRFDNVLKRPTEFRKTLYLGLPVHSKVHCNSGTSKQRKCIGQILGGRGGCWGLVQSLDVLSCCAIVQVHECVRQPGG